METLDAIYKRRTIRKFSSSPVEFDKVLKILEAGTQAPSAGNLQNWRFILVTDPGIKAQLPKYCLEQHYTNAPVVIIVCANVQPVEQHYGIRGSRLYSVQNIAACIQNMLLAATDLGLGSCWVGAFDEEKIQSMFAITHNARPQAILAFGYSDDHPRPKHVRELQDCTYFNSYGETVKDWDLVMRNWSSSMERKTAQLEKAIDQGSSGLSRHFKKLKKRKPLLG